MKARSSRAALLMLLIVLGAIIVARIPVANIVEGPAPVILNEAQIRFDPGTRVEQRIALYQDTAAELQVRLWVQVFPSFDPFLNAQLMVGNTVIDQTSVQLPPANGAFQRVTLPWWRLPRGTQQINIVLEGRGVFVQATSVDRVPGGALTVNGRELPSNDLLFQLTSGDRGIDRYLPVSEIAAGKPGLLAWPHAVLLLAYAYLLAMIGLVCSVPRLARFVQHHQQLLERQRAGP